MKRQQRLGLVLLLFCSALSSGCSRSGSLCGEVLDAGRNQQPIPFITIEVLGTSRGGLTNEQGKFLLKGIPPGTRRIRFSNPAYKPEERQVEVGAGASDTLEVSLAPNYPVPSFEGIYSTRPDTATIDSKDLIKYPRSNFAFRLKEDGGDEINAFTGTVTKTLGIEPDTVMTLVFTAEELDRIYAQSVEDPPV